ARTRDLLSRPATRAVRTVSTVESHGELRLDDLSVRHAGRDRPAVSSFTTTIAAGETVRLTGPSGAGKSTVLDVLAGRLRPGTGTDVTGGVTGVPARVGHVPQ